MVIDDEPFILMMIEDKLKKAGIEVVTLRESTAAVDRVKRERPDLVILDWMMPDVSGIEICRTLKADPDVSKALSPAELAALFDLGYHTAHVDTIFARVFGPA